jgi:hypothetical protein
MDLTPLAVALIASFLGYLLADRKRIAPPQPAVKPETPIATIAVDSGMVWIGDPAMRVVPAGESGWRRFADKAIALGYEDQGIARFDTDAAAGSLGVAIHSGGSDGVFPVFVRRDGTG